MAGPQDPKLTWLERVGTAAAVIMGVFFAVSITAAIGVSIYSAVVGDGDDATPRPVVSAEWSDDDTPGGSSNSWERPDDGVAVRVGAVCRDGTLSTATGRGACSWHGGVAEWLYD